MIFCNKIIFISVPYFLDKNQFAIIRIFCPAGAGFFLCTPDREDVRGTHLAAVFPRGLNRYPVSFTDVGLVGGSWFMCDLLR